MKIRKVIVMYGGSFNPPLLSHFSLAEQIISEYEQVEKVIFVPVNSEYEKSGLASNQDRYNMLKLEIDRNKDFILSDIEIKSDKPLYTIESLEILQKQYPDYEFWFTMGTDNLRLLETWNRVEELTNKYKIIILERDKDKVEDVLEENKFLKEHQKNFLVMKNIIKNNMSSTIARQRIKEGKGIRYFTTEEIEKYIKENDLYKGGKEND